jgi:hypothetical protein
MRVDRAELQIVLEVLERGLDLDELDVELPHSLAGSSSHRLVGSR